MHIAIDARMYGTKNRGIGRYLMKLIEALEEVSSLRDEAMSLSDGVQYTIFLRTENFEEYQPKNPRFKKALWDVPWYGWREQVFFRSLLKTRDPISVMSEIGSPDIVHFPHWNIPLFFNRPFIVTIHDLELFSSNRTRNNTTRGRFIYWFKFQMFKIIFRHAILAACVIIVPSNVVREQLLDLYPQVRNKVQVLYEAPTLGHDSITTVRHENNLPKHYLLYVGAAYPHKNLARLFEAWKILHKEFPDYKLVLAGREDFFWKKLKSMSYVLDSRSSIVFYGEASDTELATLYQNAALLVQPSLEEGFSLAPLEALAFGCPVAVSDIPVHHEILKNIALFFNPLDPHSLAQTVRTVLTDQSSKTRVNAQSAPLLALYSWKSHAQKTRDLYESVCKV